MAAHKFKTVVCLLLLYTGVAGAADKLPLVLKQQLLLQQYQQAVPTLKHLSTTGNSQAQYQLALLYLNGVSVKKSTQKAEQLLLQSAPDNAKASFLLGSLYAQGAQLERNLIKAKKWLTLSRASGNKKAQKLLNKWGLAGIMSSRATGSIMDAVMRGKLSEVTRLYDQGAKLDVVDGQGNSPLHLAVTNKNNELAQWLMTRKADINRQNNQQQTPLILAIVSNNQPMAQQLINADAVLTVKDKLGKTALVHAKALKMRLTVEKTGKKIKTRPNLKKQHQALKAQAADKSSPYFEWPVLAIALAQKQSQQVKQLLAKGHSPWHLPIENSALGVAIRLGESKYVSQLLTKAMPADTNQMAAILLMAIEHNRLQAVHELLKIADLDGLDALGVEQTPLWQAIEFARVEIAAALLNRLPADDRQDQQSRSALILASQRNLPQIAKLLIKQGVSVNLVDDQGRNALWYAADFANSVLVESLITAKSPVGQADHLGFTPLMRAVLKRCYECAAVLLMNSADGQKSANSGNSALMFAAQGKAKLLALILKFQSKNTLDLTARNGQSLTPLMLAVNSDCARCVTLLLEAGANPYRKNDKGQNAFDLAKNKQAVLAVLSQT